MVDVGSIIAAVGAVGTMVVWAIRLEGRLDTHTAKDDAVQGAMKDSLEEIKTDVREIRDHLRSAPPRS